jgi:biotin-(acetyl-CoA carboxylase) ligase
MLKGKRTAGILTKYDLSGYNTILSIGIGVNVTKAITN